MMTPVMKDTSTEGQVPSRTKLEPRLHVQLLPKTEVTEALNQEDSVPKALNQALRGVQGE